MKSEDVENFGELLVKEIIRVMELHKNTITNNELDEFKRGMEAAIEIVELNFGRDI